MPLWAPFGASIIVRNLENSHYNSLSREEKIAYLENKLNTTYKYAVMGFNGPTVWAYATGKDHTKRKLERLKSNP